MGENIYTLVLYTKPSEFVKLEAFVEKISDQFNIGHTYFSNIIVTLSELVKNAMIHGNRNKPEKIVEVSFEHNEGKLIFTVKDQGVGFGFEIPDVSEFQSNPGIRNGLSIVQSLSDSLSFNSNGSEITVSFDISSANELLGLSRLKTLIQSKPSVKSKKSFHG